MISDTDRADCLEEEYEELSKYCDKQQAEIDRLRGLLREWLNSGNPMDPPICECELLKHEETEHSICHACRTRKELEPTDGSD